jgi:DNA modification methylase
MNDLLHPDAKNAQPINCLGLAFPDHLARRDHFLKLLAERLKDPVFRAQEGFPQGTDDAILAMSDPPYYTACPNPWLAEFVKHYGKAHDPNKEYAREPMAIDVSVGKTDSIYKAHGYHTKVPHLAIVPSILHFTEPGDIVLDGFAGSGMTGVAAQWCGTAPASYRHEIEMEWRKAGITAPKWGARRSVLNDLAPAATFIGANYNLPFDVDAFADAGNNLLEEVEREIGWMYETLHSDKKTKGRIEFTVWSEAFSCSNCGAEIVFLEAEKAEEIGKRAKIKCHECGAQSRKEEMEIVRETFLDDGEMNWRPKRFPVLISYSVNGKRFEKSPDDNDLIIISKVNELGLPRDFPKHQFRDSKTYKEGRMRSTNTRALHHLYLPRAAHALACMWRISETTHDPRQKQLLRFLIEQSIAGLATINRYSPTHFSQVNRMLNGVLYVGSQHSECSPWYILGGKLGRMASAFSKFRSSYGNTCVSTGSSHRLPLDSNSIDYAFVDPPFGFNIFYADLNALVEKWHGVVTALADEAVIDDYAHKDLMIYERRMSAIFAEFERVLKPGRWMTVVFSNSQSSVWNAIQVALQKSGFVVAEVATLDKKQGSFKQVTSNNAVKQDLVISAYKPNSGLEQRLSERGAAPESAWDFVQTHLRQLPVAKLKSGILEMVVERDPRRIYDRMVAWFVRHDFPVPLSTEEFLDGLRSRFPERDGMVFLPEQVAEYDRKRATAAQAPQIELFVSDERSAIDWLMDFLRKRPSTYQEVHPEFTTQVGAGWRKHEERPELSALLADNFLRYDGSADVPSQIHSYLSTNFKDLRGLEKDALQLKAKAKDRWYAPDPSRAKDLEQKRERSLLKEFETYKSVPGRKLKEFRLEVLRAGFKTAWAGKDYKTIISLAQKIPEEALQEDEKLLLWYDQALTRMEADA